MDRFPWSVGLRRSASSSPSHAVITINTVEYLKMHQVATNTLLSSSALMPLPNGTQTKMKSTRASTLKLYACHCSEIIYCSCFTDANSRDSSSFLGLDGHCMNVEREIDK